MCLILESDKVKSKIADKDIPVYKVFKRDCYGTSYGITPYFYYKYVKGWTVKSRLKKLKSMVNTGLHSFKSNKYCSHRKDVYIFVKMYIPKGARYYTGTFMEKVSYASTRLEWRDNKRKVNK